MKFKMSYTVISSIDGRTEIKTFKIFEGKTTEDCSAAANKFLKAQIARGQQCYDITAEEIKDDAPTV